MLLSEQSAKSPYVFFEVNSAYARARQHGSPIIFPVRVAYTVPYTEMPSYALGALLSPLQYIDWKADGDEKTIGKQLHLLMTKDQQENLPSIPVPLATDGNPVPPNKELSPPLPAFDPQWLKRLDPPSGVVRLQSPFYIPRQIDEEAKTVLLREGETLRIKGSAQTGKTSLLARLYQYVRDNNYPALYIDFGRLNKSYFKDIETLLLYLANTIAASQKTNERPDQYWQGQLSPNDKFMNFLAGEVLTAVANPFVLMLDKVDRIFVFNEYRDDFFSLVRSWNTISSFEETWTKLNVVVSYSTEAFLFIQDMDRSPFNIGTQLNVTDFNRTQVEDLNSRYKEPVKTAQEIDALMELLAGHPFLIRRALYELAVQHFDVKAMMKKAYDDDGPFSDHLHLYLWYFDDQPDLREAMKSVINDQSCSTDTLFYRLHSSGLVHGTDRRNVYPRCGLYAGYFKKHL